MNKMKVKVIKKGEQKAAVTPKKPVVKAKQKAAREMVSTVTTWVNEFQQRKREETKTAIETFLSQPRPIES